MSFAQGITTALVSRETIRRALNPATPLAAIEEVLPFLDIVLVMAVTPGFGGQSFIPHVLGKVRRLRHIIDEQGYPTLIEIDGGVKPDRTAQESVKAGADILVGARRSSTSRRA